jgi:hypothetical protein
MDEQILTKLLVPILNLEIPKLEGVYLEDSTDPGKEIYDKNNMYIVTTINENDIINNHNIINNIIQHKNYKRLYHHKNYTIFVFEIVENLLKDIEIIKSTDYDKISDQFKDMIKKYYKLDNIDNFFDEINKQKKNIIMMNELNNTIHGMRRYE